MLIRPAPDASREVPLRELLRRLAQLGAALGEAQIGIARAELASDLEAQLRRLRALVAGTLLAFVGLQLLAVAMVLALATRLDGWLAALLLSIPFLLAGAAALRMARPRGGKPFMDNTVKTLKENVRWLGTLWS